MKKRIFCVLLCFSMLGTLLGCSNVDDTGNELYDELSQYYQSSDSGKKEPVLTAFALPYLQSGKLFALRFNQMIPKRNFLLVTPSGGHMSPAAENLLHLIYERNENIYD